MKWRNISVKPGAFYTYTQIKTLVIDEHYLKIYVQDSTEFFLI